ncbi:MAG: hypothetical protein QGH45_24075 [Myxococcota bacterium]|nr:hypothetical protein [Myxococcota bacterium]
MLLVLAAAHLRAYLGDAGLEHFEELVAQLQRFDRGLWDMGPERGGEVTGGAQLYFLLHQLLRWVGLPFEASQLLHAGLEAAALVGWLWLAPRVLPRTLVWSAALWLAVYPVPKLFLMENSALVSLALAPMLPLVLAAVRDGGLRPAIGAAVLMGVALHLSLIPLPVLPALLVYGAVAHDRPRWPLIGVLALTPLAALLPFLLTLHHQGSPTADAVDSLICLDPAALVAGLRWSALWNVAALAGAVLAFRPGYRDADVRRVGKLAVAWVVLGAGIVPLTNLCDQVEPFHLAATAPARVLLAGMALDGALTWARRRLGVSPVWALIGIAVGIAVLTALGPFVRGLGPAERWRGERVGHRCAATDAGAVSPRELRGVVVALEAGGHLSPSTALPVFHGAHASNLGAARIWDGPPASASVGGPADELLLLGPADALEGVAIPGAVPVDEFLLVRGVEPAEVEVDVDAAGAVRVALSSLGRGLAYVEIEGMSCVDPGEVRVIAGEARILAAVRCADVHDRRVPRTLRFGSFLVVQGADAGRIELDLGLPDGAACSVPAVRAVRWGAPEGAPW